MRDLAGHDDLLDLVYGTAVDSSLWPALLDRFAGLIGGHAAALRSYDFITEAGTVVAAGLDSAMLDAQLQRFASLNPLKSSLDHLHRVARNPDQSNWTPGIMRDVDWLSKEEFIGTEYYNEFYKCLDIHSDLSMGLSSEKRNWTGVDVYRPKRHGLFSAEEMALCRAFHPHFLRAQKLARRLAEERGMGEGLAAVFDRSPHGLFLLDRDGRLRHVNAAGRQLIDRADGLMTIGGRLVGAAPAATRRLQDLVYRAGSPERGARAGGSMALATSERLLPLSVIVAPIAAEHVAQVFDGPAVMVCVTDLEAGVSLPQQHLRELFALSAAESRVAIALFEGFDPKQAAAHLGLALATVRTHMAHIFAKTGTASQVELARLMMRTLGAGIT